MAISLSLLCLLQFMELPKLLPSAEAYLNSSLSGAELAVPSSLFCAFTLLWAMTSYTISTEGASARFFPFKTVRIHLEYVDRLSIEKSPMDRILGTNRVTFFSRHGKVLQQWSYVRLDKGKLSLLRKFALLVTSLRSDRTTEDL